MKRLMVKALALTVGAFFGAASPAPATAGTFGIVRAPALAAPEPVQVQWRGHWGGPGHWAGPGHWVGPGRWGPGWYGGWRPGWRWRAGWGWGPLPYPPGPYYYRPYPYYPVYGPPPCCYGPPPAPAAPAYEPPLK